MTDPPIGEYTIRVPATLRSGKAMKNAAFVEALAAILKATADEKGLTAADLVRATGLPHDSVSHYLAGRREPSLSAARKLCRGLGISLSNLDKLLPPVERPKENSDDAG